MTKSSLVRWCKDLEIDPTDADEILWTVDEMEGMFGDEEGLYQEIREYVYNNMMDGISLEEKDSLTEEIKRDSYIEKCIDDAIKVSGDYNLENISVETTPQGNLHIMTSDGKDICTIDGSKFSEKDIDDLRVNGYIKEEELEEINEEKLIENTNADLKCSHCGSDNITFGNKMVKLEDDNLSAYTFCQCNKCKKFTKFIYTLTDTIQMKPATESKKITEGKGMMDLIDSMQNWATASTTEYNKTKNKEYLDLAGLIEKVIDKSKDIIEDKNDDKKVEESKKLTESIITFEDLKNQIIDAYHSVLPNCGCVVSKGALGRDTFFITFYLANDKSEFPNGIAQNDLFNIDFYVTPDSRDVNLDIDSKLPETLTLEVNNNTITTTPTNQYMAYGSERVPLRKVSGTPEKIVQTITKYAQKTKDVLNKLVAEDRVPKDRIELVNSKLK